MMDNLERDVLTCLLLNMRVGETDKDARDKVVRAYARLEDDMFTDVWLKNIFVAMRAVHAQGGVSLSAIRSQMETTNTFHEPSWFGVCSQIDVVGFGDLLLLVEKLHESMMRRKIGIELRLAVDELQSKSASEMLLKLNKRFTEFQGGLRSGGLVSMGDVVKNVGDDFEKVCVSPRILNGVPSGFNALDKMVDGFKDGVYVILALTNQGKSFMATSLVYGLCVRQGAPFKNVLMVTTEMPAESWTRRVVARDTGINAVAIEKGYHLNGQKLSEEEKDRIRYSLSRMENIGHAMRETSPSASQVAVQARVLKNAGKLDLIVVDSGSNLRSGDGEIYYETRDMSNTLKSLSVELGVPIIVTIQGKPEVAQRRNRIPTIYDTVGGGSTAQDADVIITLYNHHYYVKQGLASENDFTDLTPGDILISLQKHRWAAGGGTSAVVMRLEPGVGFFSK